MGDLALSEALPPLLRVLPSSSVGWVLSLLCFTVLHFHVRPFHFPIIRSFSKQKFALLLIGVAICFFFAFRGLAQVSEVLHGWYSIRQFRTCVLLGVLLLTVAACSLGGRSKKKFQVLSILFSLAAAGLIAEWMALSRHLAASWRPLSSFNVLSTVQTLRAMGFEPSYDLPFRWVRLNGFRVFIRFGCSGTDGITTLLLILGIFLYLERKHLRFPNAYFLLPLAFVLSLMGNTFRLVLMMLVGAYYSHEIALNGFHAHVGWIFLSAIGLITMYIGLKDPHFSKSKRVKVFQGNPTLPYLLPLMVLVMSLLLSRLFDTGEDRFYPVRILAAGLVLFFLRGALKRWSPTFDWGACGIGALAFFAWLFLEKFHQTEVSPRRLLAFVDGSEPLLKFTWLSIRILGSTLVIPLVEELAFRGYLARRLVSEKFERVKPGAYTPTAFFVSSILFGGLHGRFIAGMFAGMLFFWAASRSKRLFSAVLAHATCNGLIALYVIYFGEWGLWL